jgi:hypothetical protein
MVVNVNFIYVIIKIFAVEEVDKEKQKRNPSTDNKTTSNPKTNHHSLRRNENA